MSRKIMIILACLFFSSGCYESFDNVAYKVSGDSAFVDIIYRDKKGHYITLEDETLPWSYEWNETIDENNNEVIADLKVINSEDNFITAEVIDNDYVVLFDTSFIMNEVIHLKRSW